MLATAWATGRECLAWKATGQESALIECVALLEHCFED